MNSGRYRDYLVPTLVLIAGIGAVVFGILWATSLLFPGLVGESGRSLGNLGGSLAGQVTAVSRLTGLSPLNDALLFVASYALVCILLWLQGELRTYLTNRSHFG